MHFSSNLYLKIGSTLLAAWGLPPMANYDDPIRACLSALQIEEVLKAHDLKPSIGISTGRCFCGNVGSNSIREFGILGDHVNLTARLMQNAGVNPETNIVISDAVCSTVGKHLPTKKC